MSIAPYRAHAVHVQSGPLTLAGFDRAAAPLIASWVRDADELFRLAPKTPPPLTAAKVIAWPGNDGCPLLLHDEKQPEPVGYAELNPMPGQMLHLWIGHCVIRPELRGTGLGRRLMEMLLRDAFVNLRALSVSLVVFPDNTMAVRCYRSAGMVFIREQMKYMPTTGRQHCMLELRITRAQYAEMYTSI
ncbi:MAG TPA: GNAT family N-acetyltransferase [Phycisphaerae bacterium]|nr:GNAT family N-acetyltransferase [Phycisphaerae bacterium]